MPLPSAPTGRGWPSLDGDRGIRVFDLATRSQVGVPLGLDTRDIPVGFLADGRLLTSGGGAIGIWRVGRHRTAVRGRAARRLRPDCRYVRGKFVPGTDDVITQDWDVRPPSCCAGTPPPARCEGTRPTARRATFFSVSPDGKYLAAPTADFSGFGIWDLATGERVATFDDGPSLCGCSRSGVRRATWS